MMKRIFSALIAIAILAAACSKNAGLPEPEKEAEPARMTVLEEELPVFSDEGGETEIHFRSNYPWTVTSGARWAVVTPKSGDAGEELSVLVKVLPSNVYEDRHADLTFSCSNGKKEDSVTLGLLQKKLGALVVTPSEFSVKAQGETVTICVKSSSEVSFEILGDSAREWIVPVEDGSKALISDELKFEIKPNTALESRSGVISFSNESGNEDVVITQAAMAALVIETTSFSIGYAASEVTVPVQSNFEVSCSIPTEAKTWISLADEGTKALVDRSVKLTIAENPLSETREATVTFTAGDASQDVTITQAASPTPVSNVVVISSAADLVNFAARFNAKGFAGIPDPPDVTLNDDIAFDAWTSAAFNATGGIGLKTGVNGEEDYYFNGTFNGNGKTISGLDSTVPLFVATDSGSIIKDLTMDGSCSFTFTHPNTIEGLFGSIVGYHKGSLDKVKSAANVSLAAVSGVTQMTSLGGLVGRATVGTLQNNCEYSGLISTPAEFTTSGKLIIGGLVGRFSNIGSVTGCTFKGAVSNAAQVSSTDKNNPYLIVGGIAGHVNGSDGGNVASITSCTTTADHEEVASLYEGFAGTLVIKTKNSYHSAVGGIVGELGNGEVSSCTNAAAIALSIFKGDDATGRYIKSGGIVGRNAAEGVIRECINNGSVQHRSNPRLQDLGGIAGYNAGTISSCTNNAAVNHMTSGQSIKAGRVVALGGVIGENVAGAAVSDIHNTANIQISSMEDGTASDVRMGGVIGLNQAAIDGGASKAITNSGQVYFSPNFANQFLGYEIGGIVGLSEASVENARNSGYVYLRWNSTTNVASKIYLGGIVGKMAGGGTIGGCVNEGGENNAGEVYPNVAAGTAGHNNIFAGGILGYSEADVTLSDCANSGYVHGGNGTRVKGTSFYTGGIVAYLKGASKILDCTNTGNVANTHNNNDDSIGSAALNGGIAGFVEGTSEAPVEIGGTTGCSVDATLTSSRGWVAGIAGYAKYAHISLCTVENSIICSCRGIGGIVGKAENCSIGSSTFNGSTLYANNVQLTTGEGGIAGYASGCTIDGCSCHATQFLNNVNIRESVGAIVGLCSDTTISSCHYKESIEVPTAGTSVTATVVGSSGSYTDGGGNAADL